MMLICLGEIERGIIRKNCMIWARGITEILMFPNCCQIICSFHRKPFILINNNILNIKNIRRKINKYLKKLYKKEVIKKILFYLLKIILNSQSLLRFKTYLNI